MQIPDIFYDIPPIETERLLLRRIELDDVGDLFALASDPEVLKYSIGDYHQTEADTERFIQSIHFSYDNNLAGIWGVTIKPSPVVVGTCGFELWFPDHYRAELGYSLIQKEWNKGYMSEATAAMVRFGFESELQLNRIDATCQRGNIHSIRILEKLGMKREGYLREYIYSRGVFYDVDMYSVLRSEFLSNLSG